jgi:hypothetical protein
MPTNFSSPKLTDRLLAKIPRPEIPSGGGQHDVTAITVSFLTNKDQLEEFLPDRMEVSGEPVLTVSFVVLDRLDWLGGHGYNLITVSLPAAFNGEKDQVIGSFLPVVWENMCEPIIAGRELLGWSKIFADIPMPRITAQEAKASAGWKGFQFLDIEIKNLEPVPVETLQAGGGQAGDGTMHFRYFPKPGINNEADVACVTLCEPAPDQPVKLKELRMGEGTVRFHASGSWQQLPTMLHIVNALADLEIKEFRGGFLSKSEGGGPGVPRVLR